MNTRAAQAFDNFSNALARLEDALSMPYNDDTRDIIILRFMFTYETAWKAFKWVLQEHLLIDTKAPKPTLQEAFAQGWLGEDDQIWFSMAQDRNIVVHTYNEEQANAIIEHIKQYASLIRHAHNTIAKTYSGLVQ